MAGIRTWATGLVVVAATLAAAQLWNSPLVWRIGAGPHVTHSQPVTAPACEASGADGQVIVAAVLRNQGPGWAALDDAGHAPLNVRQVDTDANEITVRFAFAAAKVLSFVVTPDETLAGQGYFVGASVGLDEAIIRLSSAAPFGVADRSPLGLTSPTANIWVYGLFEGSCP